MLQNEAYNERYVKITEYCVSFFSLKITKAISQDTCRWSANVTVIPADIDNTS